MDTQNSPMDTKNGGNGVLIGTVIVVIVIILIVVGLVVMNRHSTVSPATDTTTSADTLGGSAGLGADGSSVTSTSTVNTYPDNGVNGS